MSEAIFLPAWGDQFSSAIKRGIEYKGRDVRWFTNKSLFQYKYGLQTVYYGRAWTKDCPDKTFREVMGIPDDFLLVGDSAGFQVATFKEQGKPCDITPLESLRWQEENCNIVMNLDVPPNLFNKTDYENFKQCLDESCKNFEFFEKNRINYNVKFYNVLHGDKIPLMEQWYNRVKDFKFDGWATGIKPTGDPMLQALGFMFLYEKGEFDNCVKGQHFFGVSGKHVVPTMVYCASKLRGNMVTYDSSSYNTGSIFREYKLPFDIGPTLGFGDKMKTNNPHLKILPCMCPVCQKSDVDDMNRTDIIGGTTISLHNMYQYIHYNNVLNSIVHDKEVFLQYLKDIGISNRALKSIEFIDFVIEHGLDNAMSKFKQEFEEQLPVVSKQKSIWGF